MSSYYSGRPLQRGGGDNGRNPYYHHDDREGHERVVKFKGGRNRKKWNRRQQRDYDGPNPRSRLDADGDVAMNEGEHQQGRSRMTPYDVGHRRVGPRGGGGRHRRGVGPRNIPSGGPSDPYRTAVKDGWYKVTIPFGDKLSKDFILKSINNACRVPFKPFQFSSDKNIASFYVETLEAARACEVLSNTISTPTGFRLKIHAKPSQPPGLSLNADVLEKIKFSMSKRFDADTNRLDLTAFHNDPDLREHGIYAALMRGSVLTSVARIIEENIPSLQILNLSDNRIRDLEPLKTLGSKVRGLKSLLLRKNCVGSMTDLDHIKDLNLEELVLDGNPVCDNFKDQNNYISAVRQRFPKIVRLDGLELPPQYGFGLDNETTLPPSQGSFFVSDMARSLAPEFLKQYYGIYDSDSRQPLLEAYHDDAFFSLSTSASSPSSRGSNYKGGAGGSSFNAYMNDDRNLLSSGSLNKRNKQIRQGKLAVVTLLCDLPKTQHDPVSFTIDVAHTSPTLMSISCTGIFKEGKEGVKPSKTPLRSFSRVFMLVPQGNGFCIINDMLFIANATVEQAKAAFKVPAPTPSPSPVPPAALVPLSAPVAVVLTPEQQQQMIVTFSQQSGMNTEWSAKCLAENEWDFDKAAAVFQDLNKLGRIPAVAFVK